MDLEILATRVRALLPPKRLEEKRMFGGITFMRNGNMLCCASPKGLMVRVGKAAEAAALARPFAERCRGTGREMPGFVLVQPKGLQSENDLSDWLLMARRYVDSLPPKPTKKARRRGSRSTGKTMRKSSK